MSKPRLYGSSKSRAFRSLWALEELGIDYEHIPTSHQDEAKLSEYLTINPNGRIPALSDGDLNLFEAMAINLHLARSYGEEIYPTDANDESRVWQWTFWGMTELEPLQIHIAQLTYFTPAEEQNQADIDTAIAALDRPLGVLDGLLTSKDWLVGSQFTIADLNVASVLDALNILAVDYSHFSHVKRWADACYARSSYRRTKQIES
jgi:glutathione S-transferase|tara:strand:- start:1515 stop:2129 length:615 start_codon:yes stop_codon:yes gene_type:complete